MQYNFLGFSVSKMMELNLDMKDISILRYFVDFRETGKMTYEIVEGEKYYWINYKSIEEEMPYLGLGKRAIMIRMLKLKDLGILIHYTKKEGGTYSFYNLGPKYNELINIDKDKVTKNKYESNKYENEDMYEDRYEEDYKDESNKDEDRCEEDYEDKSNEDKNRYEEDYKDKFNEDEDRYEEDYEEKFNEDKNRYEEDYEDKFNEDKNRYEKDYEDKFNEDKDRYEEDYKDKFNKEEDSFLEVREEKEENKSREKQEENRQEKKDKQSRGKQEEKNKQQENTKQYSVQEKEQYLNEIPDYVQDYAQGVHENEIAVCTDMSGGCVSKGRTKTLLLNNSSTKETNIKKYIKKEIEEIVEYLNQELGTNYKPTFKSTIKLIDARLTEGFTVYDFKIVIDKKVKDWTGTEYEEYLIPTTLFGDKFEKYLNQKNFSEKTRYKNSYEPPKLRFNNFTGREYDYEELEKKLLGW